MLSAIIIARNEEHNIRRCLVALDWVDEIIVLDSGSTDNTIQIAKEYTDKVYQTDWQGYGVQKQRALNYASGEWILNIDADEVVSPELKKSILKTMASNRFDACRVPIKMCFYNKVLRYSSSPSRHVRLFKKDGAAFSEDIVHEKIILPSHYRIGQLKAPLIHYSFKDVSHMLEKLNRYSSYSAKIKIKNHCANSLIATICRSLWMFTRCYFLQRGFLDGKEGFIFAYLNAQGTMFRGIKQIYHDSGIDGIPTISKENQC